MTWRLTVTTAALLALVACGTGEPAPSSPGDVPASAPATTDEVSEAAINLAFQGLDGWQETLRILILTKQVTPGSPTALQLADQLDTARKLLNEASTAQQIHAMLQSKQALERAQGILALLAQSTRKVLPR